VSAPRRTGSRHVAVVGAGISGLATAYQVLKASSAEEPMEVTIFEAGGRAGGKLWTIELDGMPLEAGADSFVVRKPWAVELSRELGLEDQVVIPGSMGAYVWSARGLVPYPEHAPFGIPSNVGDLLGWPGLGRGAKLKALLDLVKPASKDERDEALGALLRRRLGSGVARVMVEPLLAGLHAGDPLHLSVRATFPELGLWERQYGSLLRGARVAANAAKEEQGRQPMFATVWGGLGNLIERLVGRIGGDRVLLDTPVSGLGATEGRPWIDAGSTRHHPDAVVLATPAFESARLVGPLSAEASSHLAAIPYVSTAVVYLVYAEGTADRLPEGTGFVVPPGRATITACTWVSRKWPHETFADRAVLRCFIGRAGDQSALELPDDELVAVAAGEVAEALAFPLLAEPASSRVIRWNRALPQYEVGHLDRLAAMERALATEAPAVFVTGSCCRGVGIADCIQQAKETAERVTAYVNGEARVVSDPVGQDREAISWTS
jgi:protoporphyrinogen/coproporphyrinogen III oxidase